MVDPRLHRVCVCVSCLRRVAHAVLETEVKSKLLDGVKRMFEFARA